MSDAHARMSPDGVLLMLLLLLLHLFVDGVACFWDDADDADDADAPSLLLLLMGLGACFVAATITATAVAAALVWTIRKQTIRKGNRGRGRRGGKRGCGSRIEEPVRRASPPGASEWRVHASHVVCSPSSWW